MPYLVHMSASEKTLSLPEVLYALGDPVRLQIVRTLASTGETCCSGAMCDGEIAKSTRTHHLNILREAGVIATRKEGRNRLNRLCREELDAAFPGLLDAVLQG